MTCRLVLTFLVGWLIASASLIAQSAATGAIEGRVFDKPLPDPIPLKIQSPISF